MPASQPAWMVAMRENYIGLSRKDSLALLTLLAEMAGALGGLVGWANVRERHGMIFPEELSVHVDPLRAALARYAEGPK